MVKSYGTHPPKSAFSYAQERRLNHMTIMLSALGPVVFFAAIFALMSFSIHYYQTGVTYLLIGLGAVLTLAVVRLAIKALNKSLVENVNLPSWSCFSALSMVAAFVLAVVVGSMNYWMNTRPYCEIDNLTFYHEVDPETATGMQLMDAGKVTFVPNAHIDLSRFMGFKNNQQYCVAPIVTNTSSSSSARPATTTHDLWVVGLNCCATDFQCGEYSNVHAHGGLRLVRADQAEYFRLAVQQAEAAYTIRADHPIFFYWMQDPVADLHSMADDAMKLYVLGCFTFFAYQVAITFFTLMVLRKLGLE
jgi:uncharacterized membrane protein